jgi:serine/threonine-protein phosphatase 2A regulatory subunit A
VQVLEERLNVITNLHHVRAYLGPEQLKSSILQWFEELIRDPHWRVRHSITLTLPLLALRIGLCSLSNKSCLQVPEVRLNVITNLHHARDYLSPEQLKSSILPWFEDLVTDPHWRVRHSVILALPLLAQQLGLEFYEARLLVPSREWLHDPVSTIRVSAMKAFIKVAEVFGDAWAAEKAVPMLLEELKNPFYLYRITCIQVCRIPPRSSQTSSSCFHRAPSLFLRLPLALCWDSQSS